MHITKRMLALLCTAAILLSLGGGAFAAVSAEPYTLVAEDCTFEDNATGVTLLTVKKEIVDAHASIIVPERLDDKPVTVLGGGSQVFGGYCWYLRQVTLPEGLTAIAANAFDDCNDMTSVVLPGTLKTIGDKAFDDCYVLVDVVLPEGLTTIGAEAFGNTAITSVNLPSTVVSLGQGAFSDSKITEIVSLGGMTELPDYLFYGCKLLKSATLPATITSIGTHIFRNCEALETVVFPEGITALPDYALSGCSALTDVTLPDSITTIGSYAFQNCFMLRAAELPDGVTGLGIFAFSGCRALESITIPEGVTTLPMFLFEHCWALQTIHLPAGLTTVERDVFAQCRAVQSLTFPATLNSLHYLTFSYNLALREVTFLGDAPSTESGYHDTNPFGRSKVFTLYYPEGNASYDTWKASGNWSGVTFIPTSQKPSDLEKDATQIKLTAELCKMPQGNLVLWLTTKVTPEGHSTDSTLLPAGNITTVINGETQAPPIHFVGGGTTLYRTVGYDVTKLVGESISVCVKLGDSLGFTGSESATLTGTVIGYTDQMWHPFGASASEPSIKTEYGWQPDTVGNGAILTSLPDDVAKPLTRSAASDVTLPTEVGNRAVTGLGDSLFEGTGVTSVVIPSAVATLGKDVFKSCAALTTVTFSGDAPALAEGGSPFPKGVKMEVQPNAVGFDQGLWAELTKEPTAQSFALDRSDFTLSSDYPVYQLKATFSPAGTSAPLTWSSNAPAIVSIDQTGKVTAHSSGVATITAAMDSGYRQSCTVRSSFPEVVPTPPAEGGSSPAPAAKPPVSESAKVTISDKTVAEAVKAAAESGSVVLKADAPADAKSVSVTVPAGMMNAVAKADAPVSLQTPVADLTLDAKVLETLQASGAKDMVVSAGAADAAALPKAAQEALTGRPVYDISITSGGKSISQFGGGSITVALPYTPAPGEDLACLTACWVKEDGTTEVLRNSVYQNGKLIFRTPHLSTYAIIHTGVSFLDVEADSWAGEAIGFTAARGMLGGVGNNHFSPAAPLTGSAAVAALARMDGVADGTGADWAAPALAWAQEKGILPEGFSPNDAVTRQQFAYLVAGFLGGTAKVENISFVDAAQISPSCLDSVNCLTSIGVMKGTGDGRFSPQAPLTRSELAAVLHRLVLLQIG